MFFKAENWCLLAVVLLVIGMEVGNAKAVKVQNFKEREEHSFWQTYLEKTDELGITTNLRHDLSLFEDFHWKVWDGQDWPRFFNHYGDSYIVALEKVAEELKLIRDYEHMINLETLAFRVVRERLVANALREGDSWCDHEDALIKWMKIYGTAKEIVKKDLCPACVGHGYFLDFRQENEMEFWQKYFVWSDSIELTEDFEETFQNQLDDRSYGGKEWREFLEEYGFYENGLEAVKEEIWNYGYDVDEMINLRNLAYILLLERRHHVREGQENFCDNQFIDLKWGNIMYNISVKAWQLNQKRHSSYQE